LRGESDTMSLIDIQDLRIDYGAQPVLRNVNLKVEPGEIITIVGPNGSGKTSLLRAIIGAAAPSTGSIVKKPGLRIGYVPQRLHIDPTLPMTVGRFMSLPGTGCAVLMISHELHVVMAASDRVVCLNGHVCCEGTPEHVSSAPEYRALFGTGTHGALALYRHEHDHTP
jgi:ABC-type Mn2+/Zn2+ transport system ATPase subunit